MSEQSGNRDASGDAGRFWWQIMSGCSVAAHDYPPRRVRAARQSLRKRGSGWARAVDEVVSRSRTRAEALRAIVHLVQSALVHPPVFQPADTAVGVWLARRLGLLSAELVERPRVREALRRRLLFEPDMLWELGEGRCGHTAALLCAALERAGFKARSWQLPHHVVVEVEWDGEWIVMDADAFKHGIMFERDGRWLTRREIERTPQVVDRFKPTGWMFRRDSVYARGCDGREFRGCVDFYSPEVDGQMSVRYGQAPALRPPGVPCWTGRVGEVRIQRGKEVTLEFSVMHAERASGYRVRCGRSSRGYRYDALVQGALAQETSAEVFEVERSERNVSFRIGEVGRYYVSAAAIPAYVEQFPSYVWWSDEVAIDVT